jgi:hypothetical protein
MPHCLHSLSSASVSNLQKLKACYGFFMFSPAWAWVAVWPAAGWSWGERVMRSSSISLKLISSADAALQHGAVVILNVFLDVLKP